MNKIQVDIDFKEGTLIPNGIDLITGDYNSTEIEFTFDEEHQNGRKVFEMKSPSKELVMLEDIVDNKIPLYGLKDITTMHNEKEYTKYIKDVLIYWYNQEDNELYDNEWNQVVTFDITEYTKVQEKASLFGEAGYYIFEISYYNNDGKLTSVHGKLPVNEEQVKVDDEVVEQYLPLFDQLMQEFVEIENTISTIQEEQITQNENIQANANSITNLQNTKQDTLVSGENIKTINNESLLGSGNLEVITDLSDYYTKEEIDNKGYINKDVDDLTNYTKTSDLSKVATSGSYNDLKDTPNLSVYSLITETGARIDLEINSSTYVLTAKLYDKNNNLLSTSTGIDLPLETMVVGASYDSETKEIILTLKNGQEVRFSVADLVSGLVSETQLQQILLNYYTKSEVDTLLSNKVGFEDYASGSTAGVIKTSVANSTFTDSGVLKSVAKTYEQYNSMSGNAFIGKGTLENVITGKELTNKTYVDSANEVQDNEISDLKSENDYLNSIINQLPKVSSQGTILTLNNTIAGRMNIELGTSELEQETTTGKNIAGISSVTNNFTIQNDVVTLANGSTGSNFINFISTALEANVEYIMELFIVGTTSNNAQSELVLKDENNNNLFDFYTTINQNITKTFTPSANASLYRLNLWNNSTTPTTGAISFKVQIRKTSTESGYEKFTGGIPAPNPSFPMPIHTISGDNTIKIIGKNIIDLKSWLTSYGVSYTESSDGSLTFTPVQSLFSTPLQFSDTDINVSISGIITNGTSTNARIQLLDSEDNSINGISQGTTKTENANACKLRFNWSTSGTFTIKNFMLETGSTASTYEPYQSQNVLIPLGNIEYCEIGDYKDEFVRSSGKNLINPNNIVQGMINDTNGNLQETTSSNNKSLDYTEIKPNTSYYFLSNKTSGNWGAWYDENKTYISGISLGATIDGIKVSPNNAKYLRFTLNRSGNNDNYLTNTMISESSTALPYEPYGIGNWGIRKNIGKIVLNGSEDWKNTSQSHMVFYVDNTTSAYLSTDFTPYCNYFKGTTKSTGASSFSQKGNNMICFLQDVSISRIMITDDSISTPADFKMWLSTHNTIVYYVLATPIYIPITGTLAEQLENIYQYLLSYKGQTNISQVNNDLPFNISASALLDLNTLVGE